MARCKGLLLAPQWPPMNCLPLVVRSLLGSLDSGLTFVSPSVVSGRRAPAGSTQGCDVHGQAPPLWPLV